MKKNFENLIDRVPLRQDEREFPAKFWEWIVLLGQAILGALALVGLVYLVAFVT